MLALFGTIILLPMYLQNVLELSTLQTGLLLLPGGLLMGRLGRSSAGATTTSGPREARDPRRHHRHGRALGHDAARHADAASSTSWSATSS